MGTREEHWQKFESDAHVRELRELLQLRRKLADAEAEDLRRKLSEKADKVDGLKLEQKLKDLQHAGNLKAAQAEVEAARSAYEAQAENARRHRDLAARAEGCVDELRAWIESALNRFSQNKHAAEWLRPVLEHLDGKTDTALDPPRTAKKPQQAEKWAAVSIIRKEDRYLCVWNTRYAGWSFPGGLVEKGEAPGDAQQRELQEEAGLTAVRKTLVFAGPTGLDHEPSRAGCAAIYAVTAWSGEERPEKGSKIAWLSREEYLAGSPFASFYRDQVFPKYDEACSKLGYILKPPYYASR